MATTTALTAPLAPALVLLTALSGAADAQGAPPAAPPAPASSREQCLKQSFELAKAADARRLPDSQLDKIEEMLNRMEGFCDTAKYPEAAKVAAEVQAAIEAKR